MRPALALLSILLAQASFAQDARLTFLSKQLDRASDPRVRAQSALLLGASHDPMAVTPLCKGLSDASDLVRSAAARALGQLESPAGLDCLKSHVGAQSGDTRAAFEAAIASLVPQKAGKAELYIALAPIQVKVGQVPSDLLRLTEERLKNKLMAMGGVFAPSQESRAQAAQVLRQKRLKGYYVEVQLEASAPTALKMNVVCFTYPERSLLGEITVKASGAKPADLIKALAPRAIDEAAATFDWRS